MEKILKYTLTPDGAFPDETLCGGVQGENKATAIVFEADDELFAKINELEAQGKTIQAKIKAVTAAGECVGKENRTGENLFSPFYLTEKITCSGLDVTVVFSIIILDDERELCKAQIKLSFIPSPELCEYESENSEEELLKKAEELFAALDERSEDVQQIIDQKLNLVKNTASLTAEHLKKAGEALKEAENARLSLEGGMEFVFSGGDAFGSASAKMIVDEELSENSINPISNKAVTEQFNEQKLDIDGLTVSVDTLRQESLENKESIDTLKQGSLEHKESLDTLKSNCIVAEGTSGIWNYRKWANGVAECWGNLEINTTVTTVWTPNYYMSESFPQSTINFPFEFAEVPTVVAAVDAANSAILMNGGLKHTKSGLGSYRLIRPLQIENAIDFVIGINVKGRWK